MTTCKAAGIALLTAMVVCFTTNRLNAAISQTSHRNVIVPEKYARRSTVEPVMKETEVDIRVVRNFRKSFPAAADVRWKQAGNFYFAAFADGAIKHKVVYTNSGALDYSLKVYGEKQLPEEVRRSVRSVYYDYAIVSAQELRLKNQTIYLVQLSAAGRWKTIRICEGNLEEIEYLVEKPSE